ncbi:cobalamin-dependent protein [bacterium]|nr:cobalamin-dependent protein [bacterium]
MRILCIYSNVNQLLMPPPVGLMLVAQNAVDNGHDVKILDFLVEKDPDTALERTIKSYQPDLIAFSLRNLDNQDMQEPVSYIPLYKRWVETANQFAPTVIGGSAFSTYPEEMMVEIPATYGFQGQADQTFGDFIRELEAGSSTFNTPGVVWRVGDKLRQNKGLLNGYPNKGRLNWDLINIKPYTKSMMSMAVITKTGCPHKCAFCDTHVTFGASFVPRDPDEIVEELRENQKRWRLNKKLYMFIDDIVNEPSEWSKTLMEKIIQSDLRLGFGAIVEPTKFDRELISLLRKAGCIWGTGLLVSASDTVLALNNKSFTQGDIKVFLDLCEEEKLIFMPQFMVGSLGETENSINDTLDFIQRYKLIMVEFGLGVRIQKQTKLYDVALKEGIVSKDDNLLFPKFYWEPSLSLDWVKNRVKVFKKKKKIAYAKWASVMWESTKLSIRN